MPEPPDVEAFRRYLARYAADRRIEGVDVRDASLVCNASEGSVTTGSEKLGRSMYRAHQRFPQPRGNRSTFRRFVRRAGRGSLLPAEDRRVSGLTGIAGVPPMSLSEMASMLDDEAAVGGASQAAGAAASADFSPSVQGIAFTAAEEAQMQALQTTQLELAAMLPGEGATPSTDLYA